MTKRDDVLDLALRHLNRDPTASMADIAEAGGISRATLHRHFATREALLREIGDRSLDRWEQTQEDAGMAAATESADAERIETCLRVMLRGFVADAEAFGFALTDCFMDSLPELRERTEEIFVREVAFWAAAQEAGVLRADVSPRWIGQAAYGLLVAARDALREGDVARRDLDDLFITTFLHGARTP